MAQTDRSAQGRSRRAVQFPKTKKMARQPVSIIILAWNAWDSTKACLDSLRPTLGVRDQVIVVDNGSEDETATGLRRYPWLRVVSNPENRGFAGGCNDGAAVATENVLIFLNNDTLLSGKWIDPLVAALEQPDAGAAGPRSNFVSGAQVIEGANYINSAEMKRFARAWSQAHRGQISETNRLVGFCVAVNTQAFNDVGGFDEAYGIGGFEDDDLCQKLIKSGRKLYVCHDSFVHHDGHKTFDANGLNWYTEQESNRSHFLAKHGDVEPGLRNISACLITKDEEENLPSCLASLQGIVDEIVVYDTGSTDRTVELATEAGAVVFDGFWDDDFSRARNAALEHCHGEWIVWVDADETLQADPITLRSLLAGTPAEVDAFSVRIDNLTGVGVGSSFVHHASRIFRRARCEWTGRLHEQVAQRGTHAPIRQRDMPDSVWIRHTGYLDEAMRSRNKAERNLRVAQAEVDDQASWDRGYSLTSLARSLMLAGRPEEGLARAIEGLDVTNNEITRRLAVRTAIDCTLALGRPGEALEWCGRLRAENANPNTANAFESTVRLAMGQWEVALDTLGRVRPGIDDEDGFGVSAGTVGAQRAQALVALNRLSEAVDALLGSLNDAGVLDTHLGSLIDYMHQAGRPLDELARAIPSERVVYFLAQLLQIQPDAADAALEACFNTGVDPKSVLATATTLAPRLGLERAMVWSARLRQAGHAFACPLLAMARTGLDAVPRARAAAITRQLFGDPDADAAFHTACLLAAPVQLEIIRQETAQICPDLLTTLSRVEATARTSRPRGVRLPVSIVIPCFNRIDLTRDCLASLAAHTDPHDYELILVDNGSSDGTDQITFPGPAEFRLIRNEENLGFSRACNQGAAAARHDIILFLNNDTLATPGWLPALVEPFSKSAVGIVGARLLYADGTLQHAGVDVGTGPDGVFHGSHRHRLNPADFPPALEPGPVTAVTGAALAIRKDVFEAVGGYYEGYWNGNEDVDLCLLVQEHRKMVWYQPKSVLFHLESQSGNERFSGYTQNVALLNERWATKLKGRLVSSDQLGHAGAAVSRR